MIEIREIKIQRFRSINDICFTISEYEHLTSIIGENNVGKTNTLRAINIFFNPEDFDVQLDIPVIKQATGGAAVLPKIEIVGSL